MRILYVTTISLTINTFFKPHIDMLVKEGHEVAIACNYQDLAIDEFYVGLGCRIHQIDFSRSPLAKDNLRAYGQLKKEDYRLAQKNLRQKKYIMFPVSVLICPDLRIFKLTE